MPIFWSTCCYLKNMKMYNYQSVYCMRCPCSIKCSTSTLLMKWKESWESRTVSPSLVKMSPQSFTTRIWMKRSIGGSISYLAEKEGNRRNSGYEGVNLGEILVFGKSFLEFTFVKSKFWKPKVWARVWLWSSMFFL